jgi:hypothetical protein
METRSGRQRVVGAEPDGPISQATSVSAGGPPMELRTIKTDQDLQEAIKQAIQLIKACRSEQNGVKQACDLLQKCDVFLQTDPTTRQLQSIKEAIKGLATTANTIQKVNSGQGLTWAKVAAARSVQTVFPAVPRVNPIRPPQAAGRILTIRPIDNKNYKNLTHKETLEKIQLAIKHAIAVERLRSGDVRITLRDNEAKEAVLRNDREVSDLIKARILRQDFPVEVQAVSVKAVKVDCRDMANNTDLKQDIIKDNKGNIPNLEITRINWIHGAKSLKPREGKEPKAASLILWVPTEEMQKQVYTKGIAIAGRMHHVRLYDTGLQIPRCYKCNKWGHTQVSCRARTACGYCAKEHDTEKCENGENRNAAKCVNCGGAHPAWTQKTCAEYAKRVAVRENIRQALAVQESRIDINSHQQFPTLQTAINNNNKRIRIEPQGERTRAPGRPSNTIQPTVLSGQKSTQTFASNKQASGLIASQSSSQSSSQFYSQSSSQPSSQPSSQSASQTSSQVSLGAAQPSVDIQMVDYQVPHHA